MPPARLATLATNLHALLARVQYLIQIADECPEAVELERAFKAGSPEAIAAFMDRLARSLRRYDSRVASLAALEGAAPYFEETWVAARRSTIDNEGSNAAALGAIVDALPTLAAYQEFRIRALRLGQRELSTAATNCARWRRKSVPVWLRKKGREALVSWVVARIEARGA